MNLESIGKVFDEIAALVDRYTERWRTGIWMTVGGLAMSFGSVLLRDDVPSFAWLVDIVSIISAIIFVIGVMFIWARFEKLHASSEYFTVVAVARCGYVLWFVTTSLAAAFGFLLATSGVSPLSSVVAAFSGIFLGVGANMAQPPRRGWPLRSLLLLKRVANWQLGSAAAILALGLNVPQADQGIFEGMSENYELMFRLLIAWVISAALLTVLLEPLKHKLEALPRGLLKKWEDGETV